MTIHELLRGVVLFRKVFKFQINFKGEHRLGEPEPDPGGVCFGLRGLMVIRLGRIFFKVQIFLHYSKLFLQTEFC